MWLGAGVGTGIRGGWAVLGVLGMLAMLLAMRVAAVSERRPGASGAHVFLLRRTGRCREGGRERKGRRGLGEEDR